MFDNLFGMFVHFGIYSTLGIHEQVQARMKVDRSEYESLTKDFCPDENEIKSWVSIAKKAGMKYICVTAKHHDGFCLWDTKYTDYNVMNTPFGKDIIGIVSKEAKKQGMKLSIYYSLPDWNHEYGYNPAASHQWAAKTEKVDQDIYREFVKNQIRELLTGYGEIYTLFWDIPPRYVDPSVNRLVRELMPGILINDRGYDEGDFSTPEREYTDIEKGLFTRRTESCESVGAVAWGFRSNEDFHTKRYLTYSIDRTMAMGGSFLLNVGPDKNGCITDDYLKRLMEVGDWYNRISASLESVEHEENLYEIAPRCVLTRRDNVTYVHLCDGLNTEAVYLKKYPSVPKRAYMLNNGMELEILEAYSPSDFDGKEIPAKRLSIRGIPADKYATEPIIIAIEW